MACRRTREHSDLEDVAVVLLARQVIWPTGGSIHGFASPPVEPSPNEIWIASGSRRR